MFFRANAHDRPQTTVGVCVELRNTVAEVQNDFIRRRPTNYFHLNGPSRCQTRCGSGRIQVEVFSTTKCYCIQRGRQPSDNPVDSPSAGYKERGRGEQWFPRESKDSMVSDVVSTVARVLLSGASHNSASPANSNEASNNATYPPIEHSPGSHGAHAGPVVCGIHGDCKQPHCVNWSYLCYSIANSF